MSWPYSIACTSDYSSPDCLDAATTALTASQRASWPRQLSRRVSHGDLCHLAPASSATLVAADQSTHVLSAAATLVDC